MGLRNIIWNIYPERASAAPISDDTAILGSLMLKTTASACAAQVFSIGRILESNMRMSSIGDTGKRPMEKDSTKIARYIIINTASTSFRLLSVVLMLPLYYQKYNGCA